MNCANNNFSKHPLVRQGASQRERFLDTLNTRYLQLDSRSFQQWLQFIYEFSENIHYYNLDNEKDGNWKIFWEKEPTAMLAIAASVDVESMEAAYRHLELEYWRRKKKRSLLDRREQVSEQDSPEAIFRLLIEEIFKIPLCLLELCNKIPYEQALKSEIAQLVKTYLQKPMDDLVSYHKAVADNDLIQRYLPFFEGDICQSAWGLNADTFIDKEKDDSFNLERLRRLYLDFRKVLLNIRDRAKKTLQHNLFTRRDHQPHLTLLLTFLQLFRYLQEDLNQLPERHLQYYYQEVLKLAHLRNKPDIAYLLLSIAPNLPDGFLVRQGTRFIGGTDASGKNRLYVATDSVAINHAEIACLQNLTFLTDLDENGVFKITGAIYLPAANMLDGLQTPLPPNDDAWSGLNGLATADRVYKKSIYELLKAGTITNSNYPINFDSFLLNKTKTNLPDYFEKIYEKLNPIIPKLGLVIATPELWMEKSKRRLIYLTFDAIDPKLKEIIKDKNRPISLWLSTAEGIVKVENEDPNFNENSSDFNNIKNGYKIFNNQLIIQLSPKFPNVVPVPDIVQTADNIIKTPYPYLLLQLDDITKYDTLQNISFKNVSIQTKSDEIGNLILQIGSSVIPASTEIPLTGGAIYIGATEIILKKNLDSLKVKPNGILKSIEDKDLYILKDYTWFPKTNNDKLISSPRKTKIIKYEAGETPGGFIRGEIKTDIGKKASAETITLSYTTESVSLFPLIADGPEVQFLHALPLSKELLITDKNLALLPRFEKPVFDAPVPEDLLEERQAAFSDGSSGDQPYRQELTSGTILTEVTPAATLSTARSVKKNTKSKRRVEPEEPVVVKPRQTSACKVEGFMDKFAHGNLFIGIKNIKPGQILSLLVQVAAGTGNAEAIAPEVVWSYWSNPGWVRFPAHFIIKDTTQGLTKSGIIRFQIPSDISLAFCHPKEKVYYIRASATENRCCNELLEAFPLLIGIHPQAIEVRFWDQNNSLEHLDKGLPAGSISQIQFRDVNIKKIEQPYDSFGGQLPESKAPARYLRRVSERLRHKKRAVTVWDYERLVLENYPDISVVKALPHTNIDSAAASGCVTVAVVPNVRKVAPKYRFTPTVEAGVLKDIQDFLSKRNSFFVGGANALDRCCCKEHNDTNADNTQKEPCDCGCESNALQVVNARFEPVRVSVCVRFRQGEDVNLRKRHLNQAIEQFLAPWANDDNKPLLFGSPIYTSQLLNIIEGLKYVDVINDFTIKHFKTVKEAEQEEINTQWERELLAVIEPFSPRGVLTTYQNAINANNSNFVDHEINVFEGNSCGCMKCIVNDAKKEIFDRMQMAYDHIIQAIANTSIDTNEDLQKAEAAISPVIIPFLDRQRRTNNFSGILPDEAYQIKYELIGSIPMLSINASIGKRESMTNILKVNLNDFLFKKP